MRIFSSVRFLESCDIAELRDACALSIDGDVSGVLVVLGEELDCCFDDLIGVFGELPVPAFAIVVPAVIFEQRDHAGGALVIGLTAVHSALLIEPIDSAEEQDLVEEIQHWNYENPISNALLFIDGSINGIERMITCLHDQLGPDVQVAGAGVGTFGEPGRPSLINADGAYSNAALLIGIRAPMVFSIGHGYRSIAGPFLVTDSDGERVHQINYRPALQVYREAIERYLGRSVDLSDFYRAALDFPFGFSQLNDSFLVREPVGRMGESLDCTAAIPTNSLVYLLTANEDDLRQSAQDVAGEISASLGDGYHADAGYHVAVLSCLARKFALRERYRLELEAIDSAMPQGVSLIGILSLGEIAPNAQGRINFMNKTLVLGALGVTE